jgi:hypothetical protein
MAAWSNRPFSDRVSWRIVTAWLFALLYALAMSFLTIVYGLKFDVAAPDEFASLAALSGGSGQGSVTTAWLNANWQSSLIDFALSQPVSMLWSFVILWLIYRLQLLVEEIVDKASAAKTMKQLEGHQGKDSMWVPPARRRSGRPSGLQAKRKSRGRKYTVPDLDMADFGEEREHTVQDMADRRRQRKHRAYTAQDVSDLLDQRSHGSRSSRVVPMDMLQDTWVEPFETEIEPFETETVITREGSKITKTHIAVYYD